MASIYDYKDYREILRDELARRTRQNSQYSQGAFARDIGIRPSRLCEILHGKQGISGTVARTIARKIQFNQREARYFVDLVESCHGRSRAAREAAAQRLEAMALERRPQPLAQKFTGDWYHYALLELMKLPIYQSSPTWISRALGISIEQVDAAIHDLIEAGLVERRDKILKPIADSLSAKVGAQARAQMALDLLYRNHLKAFAPAEASSENWSEGVLLGIPAGRLEEARALLESFITSLKGLSEGHEGQDIYCMSTHLFRISEAPLEDEEYH